MQLNHAITRIVCGHEMLHWLLAILVSLSWCCFFFVLTLHLTLRSPVGPEIALFSAVVSRTAAADFALDGRESSELAEWSVCDTHFIIPTWNGSSSVDSMSHFCLIEPWACWTRALVESRENFYTIFNFSKELHNLLINFHNEILFGAILKH